MVAPTTHFLNSTMPGVQAPKGRPCSRAPPSRLPYSAWNWPRLLPPNSFLCSAMTSPCSCVHTPSTPSTGPTSSAGSSAAWAGEVGWWG